MRDQAPLPRDIERALEFNRDENLETVQASRASLMRRIRTVAAESQPPTAQQYATTPDEIRPAAGNVHIALLSHLMGFTGMVVRNGSGNSATVSR